MYTYIQIYRYAYIYTHDVVIAVIFVSCVYVT